MTSPIIPQIMQVLKDWKVDTRHHSYPDHYMMEELLWKLDIGVMESKTKLIQTMDWFEIPFLLNKESGETLRILIKGQKEMRPMPTGRHTARHRIFALCDCGQWVPTGRLHQHKCKGVK